MKTWQILVGFLGFILAGCPVWILPYSAFRGVPAIVFLLSFAIGILLLLIVYISWRKQQSADK